MRDERDESHFFIVLYAYSCPHRKSSNPVSSISLSPQFQLLLFVEKTGMNMFQIFSGTKSKTVFVFKILKFVSGFEKFF